MYGPDRHIVLDAVHFVLQFKFLSFQEGDVELLSAVAAGKIPPHVRVIIADNPSNVSYPSRGVGGCLTVSVTN